MLPGTSYSIASIESPGVIGQQSQTARIVFHREDGQLTAEAMSVKAALVPAIDAELTEDITIVLWSKFLLTAPANAINATARFPITRLIQTDGDRALLSGAMEEVVAVGLASGVNIDPEAIAKGFRFMESPPRPTPVHARRYRSRQAPGVGSAVRGGRSYRPAAQRATPINNSLYALLLPHKDGTPTPS